MTAHPEHDLQVMINKWVRSFVPRPHFFTGIDRSGKTARTTHMQQKARGLVSGTPDTILLVPGFPLITVELKSPGNEPTDRQREVGIAIRDAGGIWEWCTTVTGYAECLRAAGVPLLARWDLAAAGHDATLAGAAIKREEAKTGVPSKKRYARAEVKPTAARLRKVAAMRALGLRF